MSKNKITGIIGLVLIFIVASFPISTLAKVGLIALIFLIIIYINRAFYYFIQGNKIIMSKKAEKLPKAWELYKKAYKAKLNYKYSVTMGNILVLRGDPEFGKEVLDSVIDNCKDQNLVKKAKVQKSMAIERLGDIEGAIKILQELFDSGYEDRSLAINLSSYLIYTGNIKEAERVIEKSKEFLKSSTGLLDNKGWIYLIKQNWEKAVDTYEDLLDRAPKFPDPYIHAAQIKLHYGEKEEAIDLLNQSLNKIWSNVTFFKKDLVEELISKLESDENNKYLHSINSSIIEVAKGDKPIILDDNQVDKLNKIPFEKEIISVKKEEEEEEPEIEITESDEDSLPNTDLTDEDLEWENNHKE